jgi:hypothetical protein
VASDLVTVALVPIKLVKSSKPRPDATSVSASTGYDFPQTANPGQGGAARGLRNFFSIKIDPMSDWQSFVRP